jgi:flagellar biogenesis protein FliO
VLVVTVADDTLVVAVTAVTLEPDAHGELSAPIEVLECIDVDEAGAVERGS